MCGVVFSMAGRFDVLSALRNAGLHWLCRVFERVADFVEGVAGVTGGRVLGFAVEVFPGLLVLNAFLDGAVVVGRNAVLELRAAGRELGVAVVVEGVELFAEWASDATVKGVEGEVLVCTEGSKNIECGERGVRSYRTVVPAGASIYVVARPTWNTLHIIVESPEESLQRLERIGISISL